MFRRMMDFVLRWEGGYSNDPDDPGGETNFGISKRAHPEINIAKLTREQAESVYRVDYWLPTADALWRTDMFAVSGVLFDFAVHSGVERAVVELQALVGAKGDGIVGARTREAVSRRAYQLLAHELLEVRRHFLADLVEAKPELGKFAAGWNRRLDALADEVGAGGLP